MTVIYGTKTKVKIDKELGMMTCTNCGHEVNAAVAHEAGYHHVYYVPLFPYLGGAKMILCPCCGIMKVLSKEEFKAQKQA